MVRRVRAPRVAEVVASAIRDDILSGRLTEGDVLPTDGVHAALRTAARAGSNA